MKHAAVFVGWLFLTSASWGQVNNDNVANRIRLVPDELPVHTTTASATVQWDCLNQALTGKCLVYHNDQWYSFQVSEPQSYFLNISRLSCLGGNGIQIIIIEGNPCETRNYRVMECIAQIRNEEVYVPLGKLNAHTDYLIEIDGFNGDHCDFDIQIARRPLGLPLKFSEKDVSENGFRAKTQSDSLAEIAWRVPVGWLDRIDQFRVFRLKEEDIIRLERAVPVSRNAYGKPAETYTIQDTLTSTGDFLYRIYGYPENELPVLLNELKITFSKVSKKQPTAGSQVIEIELNGPQRADYAVRVYESNQLSILQAFNVVYDPDKPLPVSIDMREMIKAGNTAFMVVLINKATREAKEFFYRVDTRGFIIKE